MNDSRSEPTAPRWVSKVMVIALFGWIVGVIAFAFFRSATPPVGAQSLPSPFKPWDGSWEGEFITYSVSGERLATLNVRQTYRHVFEDELFTQEGIFTNTDATTGERIQEQAFNTANLDGDNLRCRVVKDDGKTIVEHRGRMEDGILFWHRSEPGAIETFREWVEGDTYFIEGMGIYGDRATAEPPLFVGRYKRVPEADAPENDP